MADRGQRRRDHGLEEGEREPAEREHADQDRAGRSPAACARPAACDVPVGRTMPPACAWSSSAGPDGTRFRRDVIQPLRRSTPWSMATLPPARVRKSTFGPSAQPSMVIVSPG